MKAIQAGIEAFERSLGAPLDDGAVFSFAAARADDAAGRPPGASRAALVADGFALGLVPREWGGRLADYQTVLLQARCLTRRHVALMPALMYGVGPLCALDIAGSAAQRAAALADTRAGLPIAFGLSEADAGSDLAASAATCTPAGGGWRLHGSKWLIGMAAQARHAAILARSGDAGPTSMSLFWAPAAERAGVSALPAVATTGMRGIEFGGLRYDDFELGDDALIGAPGQGLELTFLCQQPVKLLSTAATLGACDTALRVALACVRAPRGGRVLADKPHVRATLAGAFADLLLLDAACQAGARALSLLPRQCSIITGVAKQAALALSDRILADTALVLGTRALLPDGPWHGAYERAWRDNAMVRAIDTNAVVNLRGLATQLDALAVRRPADTDTAMLAALYGLGEPCPPPRLARLAISNRGDAIAEALPWLAEQVQASEGLDPAVREGLAAMLALFEQARRRLFASLGPLRERLGSGYADSSALIGQGERYARIHLAASACLAWLHNRHGGDALAGGAWLLLGLQRLWYANAMDGPGDEPALSDSVWQALCTLSDAARLYSLLPIRLQPT